MVGQFCEMESVLIKCQVYLTWLNTVLDTYVSFTFFSKILDPLVTKNGSKQVKNTNFGFSIVKLT